MTLYRLNTPWRWETYGITEDRYSPYARLAGKPITGGTLSGTINPFLTDIPRGYSLLVNGTTVTEIQTPYQDDIANADAAYLGGHEYILTQAEADILINAGYSSYLTPIP